MAARSKRMGSRVNLPWTRRASPSPRWKWLCPLSQSPWSLGRPCCRQYLRESRACEIARRWGRCRRSPVACDQSFPEEMDPRQSAIRKRRKFSLRAAHDAVPLTFSLAISCWRRFKRSRSSCKLKMRNDCSWAAQSWFAVKGRNKFGMFAMSHWLQGWDGCGNLETYIIWDRATTSFDWHDLCNSAHHYPWHLLPKATLMVLS